MITIENKQTSLPKGKEDGFLTYGDLISFACLATGNTPVSLGEQRIRFKIIDAVEAGNGVIELDEKWIPVLQKCIENLAAPVNREFVEFGDKINDLQETK